MSNNESTTLTITPWVYIANQGDGSCSVYFFNEEAEAEEYASHNDERNCDDVYKVTLVVDTQTGKICNVRKFKG